MTNVRKSICMIRCSQLSANHKKEVRSTSREAAVLAWYVIYRARVIQLFGSRNIIIIMIIIIIIIIIILRFPAHDELGTCRAEHSNGSKS